MRSTPRLIEAKPAEGYQLFLAYEDGRRAEVDLAYLRTYGGVFEPLKDLGYFRRFTLERDAGTITWPSGADVAPETLYGRAVTTVS